MEAYHTLVFERCKGLDAAIAAGPVKHINGYVVSMGPPDPALEKLGGKRFESLLLSDRPALKAIPVENQNITSSTLRAVAVQAEFRLISGPRGRHDRSSRSVDILVLLERNLVQGHNPQVRGRSRNPEGERVVFRLAV